jgi:hypothetical protein
MLTRKQTARMPAETDGTVTVLTGVTPNEGGNGVADTNPGFGVCDPLGGGAAGMTVSVAGLDTAGASSTRDIVTENCAPDSAVVTDAPGIFNTLESVPIAVEVLDPGVRTAHANERALPLLAVAATVNVTGWPATTEIACGWEFIVMVTLAGGGLGGVGVTAAPWQPTSAQTPAKTAANAIFRGFMALSPPGKDLGCKPAGSSVEPTR